MYRVVRRIAEGDAGEVLSLTDEFISSGKSPARFIESFIDYFSSLLRYRVSKTAFSDYSDSEKEEIMLASDVMTTERMIYALDTLTKTAQSLKFMPSGRVLLDTAMIKLCLPEYAEGEGALALRVAELEKKLESGIVSPKAAPEEKKAAPAPKEKKKVPLTGKFKEIEDKWKEICSSTDNLRLLIALEKCNIREDSGELVLTFDDTDSIMLDILNDDKTMETLSELIEEHTGVHPEIKLRLESYYEDEKEEDEADPLNSVDFSEDEEEEDDSFAFEEKEEDGK